ncbi:MAG: alpha-L-arabinofuranosidase C-terminal domain-containing protein [Planctomycetia bacterium]|nr:alpha-L-arabinofuranosidase C-terminal domain-containing protein [Planctomycetia bacterium]
MKNGKSASLFIILGLILFIEPCSQLFSQTKTQTIPFQLGNNKLWAGNPSEITILPDLDDSDQSMVKIAAQKPTDSSWLMKINVYPYAKYRLTGKIKTENVQTTDGIGALFNIHDIFSAKTEALVGTNDWKDVSVEFSTEGQTELTVNCLLGGWGKATGNAYYKELNIEFLETIPSEPLIVQDWEPIIQIDANKKYEPISKYIYGQFIEHLGRCIYGGIWAEMLQDRKFYEPIGTENSAWSLNDSKKIMQESIEPLCIMDEQEPFVGKWSPKLSGIGLISIEQKNLKFKKGQYFGYFWAKASPEIEAITIDISSDKETLFYSQSFKPDQFDKYQKYEFVFDFPEDRKGKDDNIIFSLGFSSSQNGSLTIGCVSLMPGDHINGMRRDTLQLLKELDSPVYRWPGGNFVSGYDWKDGIGDRDKRPPRKNPAWLGIEHNDFGFDEFMFFCKYLNTEPYIAINTGNGNIENALSELEYANGSEETPFGKIRAKNGHTEPYDVRFWCIGNEMYGDWQIGHIPVEDYVKRHNDFVDAFRQYDPEIIVVGVGNVGKWNDVFIPGAFDHLTYLSEHFYTSERKRILEHIHFPAQEIQRISDAHRNYRNKWPELYQKHDLKIVMDEWNYWYGSHVFGELGTRYFLRDALGIAVGLHEFYRNSDRYFMANYAQTVNVIGAIKTNETEAELESTGLALKLYRHEFGTIPIDVQLISEKEVASGVLDLAAALSQDQKEITLAVVNAASNPITATLRFDSVSVQKQGTKFVLSDQENDPYAFNEPGQKRRIDISEEPFELNNDQITLTPLSITLLKLKVDN